MNMLSTRLEKVLNEKNNMKISLKDLKKDNKRLVILEKRGYNSLSISDKPKIVSLYNKV